MLDHTIRLPGGSILAEQKILVLVALTVKVRASVL